MRRYTHCFEYLHVFSVFELNFRQHQVSRKYTFQPVEISRKEIRDLTHRCSSVYICVRFLASLLETTTFSIKPRQAYYIIYNRKCILFYYYIIGLAEGNRFSHFSFTS